MASEKPAGELVPGRTLTQLFRVQADALAAVTVTVATWGREPEGEISFELARVRPKRRSWMSYFGSRRPNDLNAHKIHSGERLAAATLKGAEMRDNMNVTLHPSRADIQKGELLVLSVEARGSRPEAAPTVWLSNGAMRIPGHEALYICEEYQGSHGLSAQIIYAPLLSETSVPPGILLSPVTQCNLNCVHCISRDTRKSVNRLPETIRDQIRSWAADGRLKYVSSDYSGDILWADARFGGELDFLINLDVPFTIDTNGSHLTLEAGERLSRSKMDHLSISLDAATEETYRRVRKGAPPLVEVVENVKKIAETRARLNASYRLAVSFVLMRSTLDEFPDFLRLAKRVGIQIVYARHLEAYTQDMEEESLWHERERYNAVRRDCVVLAEQLGIELQAPQPFGIQESRGRRHCLEPWRSAVVLGNGDVNACCVPGINMGNLHKNTMEEIWNGPRYQALRASVNSPKPHSVCSTCPIHREIDNPDSYLIYSAKMRSKQN